MYIQYTGNINGKESACIVGDSGSICVGNIPWRREWLLTPVFLLGESRKEKPGGWEFMGLQRAGYDWATNTSLQLHFIIYTYITYTHTHTCIHILGAICKEILNKHSYDD